MSGLVLGALELSSTVNENSKGVENAISETTTTTTNEIDDNQNFKITNEHTNAPEVHENKSEEHENDLDCPSRQRSTTTNSIGSNNISIVTLDENEEDSSVIDSDSDADEVINSNENYLRSPNGIVLVNKSINPPNVVDQSSILCTNNDEKPIIRSIAVQNSSDITFGNKTFYQGPVTIKQFVYDKNKWREAERQHSDNPGFVNSSTDNINRKESDFPITKDHPDEIQKKWRCTTKQAIVSGSICSVLVCSLLVLILIINLNGKDKDSSTKIIGDGDDSRLNIPIPSSIGSDIISGTGGPLRIISRSEWIAQPPEHDLAKLELPATRVIVAHTATENCTTQAMCTFQVRLIQTFHIESRGWDDIGYNFLIGGDGAVYVGRGWDLQGAHTKGYNVKSICIAFIGTFNKVVPLKRQLHAAQKLIEEGVKLKKLTPNYALYGHRQLIPSESPGLALYEIIKKWDHWTEEIK